MSRYQKFYSTYIMSRKHQLTSNGTIWERDWTTLGERHKFERGKRPFYGDSNFVFTDNAISHAPTKGKSGKWVAHLTYDDIGNSVSEVNNVKLETNSDLLYDYAYYGSATELIRSSIENIIREFPGNVRVGSTKYQEYDKKVKRFVDSEYYVISNPFDMDFVVTSPSFSAYDNELRYLGYSYGEYVVGVKAAPEPSDECSDNMCYEEIVDYEVTCPEGVMYGFDETIVINGELYGRIKNSIYRYNKTTGEFVLIKVYNTKDYFCFENCGDTCAFVEDLCSDDDSCEPFVCESSGETKPTPAPQRSLCITEYTPLYTVTIKTESTCSHTESEHNTYILYALYTKKGLVWVSDKSDFVIQPKQSVIEEYFDTVSGFEKKLLTRGTNPLYRNRFQTPYENDRGFVRMRSEEYIWPSIGYCIDISSTTYTEFVQSMIDLGTKYDELWSDNIYRSMTHESIKNFDWTFSRHYAEGDEVENIVGGERMACLLRLYGRFFDDIRMYVNGISNADNVSYDGMNNTTTAEISDKCELHGWDMYSTIWQPYEYVLMDNDEEVSASAVKLVQLPSPVDSESPDYVCIDCANDCGSEDSGDSSDSYEPLDGACYKKVTTDPNEILMTCDFINGEYDGVPYIEKYSGWVDDTFTGYYYRLSATELLGYPYESQPDYDSFPEYCTSETPASLRVVNNGFKYYFTRTPVNETTNRDFLHDKWYGSVSYEHMTPVSMDIEFARRLYLSAAEILRTKGTKHSIDMVMGLFGFGEGDYECEEHYRYTYPVSADGDFYFYRVAIEGVDYDSSTIGDFTPVQHVPNATSASDDKIECNGTYYVKERRDSVFDAIEEANYDKTLTLYHNDIYSGVPINELVLVNNSRFIIPYYNQKRWYDGDFTFQSMGGWGRKGPDGNEYLETMAYLRMVNDIEAMLQTNPMSARYGDLCYVVDISRYSQYYQNANTSVSHYFKLVDSGSPYQAVSWENVPVTGSIAYPNYVPRSGSDVTHGDYLRVKYLSGIINVNEANNPHVGYGDYDGGEEFFRYMEKPFRYAINNYDFNSDMSRDIADSINFSVSSPVTDNDKVKLLLDKFDYEPLGDEAPNGVVFNDLNTFSQSTFDGMEYTASSPKYIRVDTTNGYGVYQYYRKVTVPSFENKTKYYLNSKVFVLRNLLDNRYYKGFFMDVILKYLMQVIPSTSILVLDNFDVVTENANTVNVKVSLCADCDGSGEWTGDGSYIICSDATLTAYPAENNRFVKWIKPNGDEVETQSITLRNMTKNVNLQVCFDALCVVKLFFDNDYPGIFSVVVHSVEGEVHDVNRGDLHAGVDIPNGSELRLYGDGKLYLRLENSCPLRYEFLGWEVGNDIVSTSETIEIDLSAAGNLCGKTIRATSQELEGCRVCFVVQDGMEHCVMMSVNNVIGDVYYKDDNSNCVNQLLPGKDIIFNTNDSSHRHYCYEFYGSGRFSIAGKLKKSDCSDMYEFDGWYFGLKPVSNTPLLEIDLADGSLCGKTLEYRTKKKMYSVSIDIDSECDGDKSVTIYDGQEYGHVESVPYTHDYEYGTLIKVIPDVADICCRFESWDGNNTNKRFTFSVNSQSSHVAYFVKKTAHVSVGIESGSSISYSYDSQIYSSSNEQFEKKCGDSMVFYAYPSDCHKALWTLNVDGNITMSYENEFVIQNLNANSQYTLTLKSVCACEPVEFICDKMYVVDENPGQQTPYEDISSFGSLDAYEATIDYNDWSDFVMIGDNVCEYYEFGYSRNKYPVPDVNYDDAGYPTIEEYQMSVEQGSWSRYVQIDDVYYNLAFIRVYNPDKPEDYVDETGNYSDISYYADNVEQKDYSVYVKFCSDVNKYYKLIPVGNIMVDGVDVTNSSVSLDCEELNSECGCGKIGTINITPYSCDFKYLGLLDEATGLWIENISDECCENICFYERICDRGDCESLINQLGLQSATLLSAVPQNPDCNTSDEYIVVGTNIEKDAMVYQLKNRPSCNINYLPLEITAELMNALYEKYGIQSLEEIPSMSIVDFEKLTFDGCLEVTEDNRFLMVIDNDGNQTLHQLVVACDECKACVECGHSYSAVFAYDVEYVPSQYSNPHVVDYVIAKNNNGVCYDSLDSYLSENQYNADSPEYLIIATIGENENYEGYEYYILNHPGCCDRYVLCRSKAFASSGSIVFYDMDGNELVLDEMEITDPDISSGDYHLLKVPNCTDDMYIMYYEVDNMEEIQGCRCDSEHSLLAGCGNSSCTPLPYPYMYTYTILHGCDNVYLDINN